MDREVRVLAAQVLEGVEVAGGREPGLGPGDVEAADALVAVAHGQLGDLPAAGGVPHRREQRDDPDRRPSLRGLGLPLREPLEHRLDDVLEREPAGQVLLGREP